MPPYGLILTGFVATASAGGLPGAMLLYRPHCGAAQLHLRCSLRSSVQNLAPRGPLWTYGVLEVHLAVGTDLCSVQLHPELAPLGGGHGGGELVGPMGPLSASVPTSAAALTAASVPTKNIKSGRNGTDIGSSTDIGIGTDGHRHCYRRKTSNRG